MVGDERWVMRPFNEELILLVTLNSECTVRYIYSNILLFFISMPTTNEALKKAKNVERRSPITPLFLCTPYRVDAWLVATVTTCQANALGCMLHDLVLVTDGDGHVTSSRSSSTSTASTRSTSRPSPSSPIPPTPWTTPI